MKRAHGRGRPLVAPGIVLAWMLLAWSPCAFGLDPALDISQYAHTSWKIRDGFIKGRIYSIAQTPDGYLWLGTEFGLYRFDGVRNILWQPPADQHLPSSVIFKLLVARDGTLWIGTDKGLASWNGNTVTQYPELAGFVFALLEDQGGSIWAGTYWGSSPTAKLCTINGGSTQCYGEDGTFGRGVVDLYEDKTGNLLVQTRDGLWRWNPGPPEFIPMTSELGAREKFAEDFDGALLIVADGRIRRLVNGKIEEYPLPTSVRQLRPNKVFRDRDGALWVGTGTGGLVHVHMGRTDVFSATDGLSGDQVDALFEDREGNVWIVTLNGLDRFREFAVSTFTVKQGLSNASVLSVLAARDGSVLLSTNVGLNRWNNGQFSIYGMSTGRAEQNINAPSSLYQDARGRIWVVTPRQFGYLENDGFISLSGIAGGTARSIVEDTGGSLWVANENLGLFHLRGSEVVQQIPWDKLGHRDFATALALDPLNGGLWIGFFQGGIAFLMDGKIQASYGVADGLGEGRVNDLRIDHDGTLWAATESGLSRLKNNRLATLGSRNGLRCNTIHCLIEDDDRSFWLYMTCGLIRIARAELDAWTTAVDQDKDSARTIQATVFDISDGVRTAAYPVGFSPQVAKSTDGKLWFPGLDGVALVDPRHFRFNTLPPPVHIESFIADRKTYDAISDLNGNLRLPPLIRDLEIDYTALSLVAPEKVMFRYKLEPRDRDWQDVGTRRRAFYTDLAPGNYRFRVMACNNSGVWNEAGTFLDFSIDPAYYQTTWFRLSCVAGFVLLLGVLYQLRVRQVARKFNVRMEERIGERTRIARDFHDTLLQSFQGVLLKFQAVTYVPGLPNEAQKKLESAMDQAEQAITEGRDAVQGLRSSTVVTNELAQAISAVGEELAAEQTGPNSPDFRLIVEGTSKDLAPLVRDEVYRIACEALQNAFRHSQAGRIEVEILYERRQLRLRVRDNGKGIEQKVVDAGGRTGHYGLGGMRERADLVGGDLEIWSERHSGTEVELTIPGSVAYAKSPAARRLVFFGKRT